MARPACCDNLNVKKGLWTAEEDAKVLAYVSKHGTGNWTAVPKKAGLKRCGKSCRLRYTNYLRPDLNHESFSPQEEELIVKLHSAIGSRWSIIAQQLPGRTDNDVKNYWNTKLRKKLTEMGIDPVTHKPFSQILADYGNIGGGFPKGGNTTRIGSLLNRELKNAFMIKSEFDQSQSLIKCIFSSPEMPQEIGHLNNNSTSTNSLDLLAQLQAIQLVSHASSYTKMEQTQPNFITQNSTLSPSTSSLSSSSSSSASWQDFLTEDVFLSPVLLSSDNTPDFIMQKGLDSNNEGEKKISERKCFEDLMPCDASFVEAMLERDNEMLSEFPSILEEPFYY